MSRIAESHRGVSPRCLSAPCVRRIGISLGPLDCPSTPAGASVDLTVMTVDPRNALALLKDTFDRIASDLSMLTDRPIDIEGATYERWVERPAGAELVHICFRFSVETAGEAQHGGFLAPLPLAVALAGYLMMSSDQQVVDMLACSEPSQPVKEAMIEIGNFVASAVESALRTLALPCERVVFEGCQGVRADVRPRLEYVEGDALAVGRCMMGLASFEAAETVLMLPEPTLLAVA